MDVIRFSGVHCQRGRKKQKAYALRGVDFSIQRGQCVCLLGPNGAGKSAMALILGLLHPTEGRVRVLGEDPHSTGVRRRIGCTPQDSEFLAYTTGREVLGFVAAHYNAPHDINSIVERFKLEKILPRQTRNLSGGQRRLLALACAFVGNPEVIVLDEPTTGLDPELRRDLWDAIRAYKVAGGTVLLTTHYLEEAETLADHVIVIDQGQIRTQGTIDQIKSTLGYRRIIFDSPTKFEPTSALTNLVQVEQSQNPVILTSPHSDEVVTYITRHCTFSNLRVEELTLEQVMVRVWKGGEADGARPL